MCNLPLVAQIQINLFFNCRSCNDMITESQSASLGGAGAINLALVLCGARAAYLYDGSHDPERIAEVASAVTAKFKRLRRVVSNATRCEPCPSGPPVLLLVRRCDFVPSHTRQRRLPQKKKNSHAMRHSSSDDVTLFRPTRQRRL